MPVSKHEEDVPLDARTDRFHGSVSVESDTIPLLDPRWIEHEDIKFITYSPVPMNVDMFKQTCSKINDVEMQAWEERANYIDIDLKWLLDQKHSCFWNHVIFNRSVNLCLDSFLKSSPRPYDTWKFLPDKILNIQKEIHHKIFLVYLRMATHKESKTNFFTPEIFGEILYENFLFDIPKMMDLCALYGGDDSKNNSLLSKMLENVFKRQPKYIDDLMQTIPSICETFDKIQSDLGVDGSAVRNDHHHDLPLTTVNDISVYLYDTSQTLISFLTVLPSLCQYFFMNGFVQRMAGLYEEVFPLLEKKYLSRQAEKSFLNKVKHGLIKTCRCIIDAYCLAPLMNVEVESSDEIKLKHLDNFLSMLMDFLSFKRFLRAYNLLYGVEVDLSVIKSTGVFVDETRLQYILVAVRDSDKRSAQMTQSNFDNISPEYTQQKRNATLSVQNPDATPGACNFNEAVEMSSKSMSDVELSSMISHIKDLFPDCGEGFILLCLKTFNNDLEKAISCILEDSLPSELCQLDRGLSKNDALKQSNVLSQRHNVYNNDEFDIFVNPNVDISRVNKGKTRTNENMRSVFNGEGDRQHIKEFIFNYEEEFNDYDDEYDDTYDEHDVGAQDIDYADELSELTLRRPFTTPTALLHLENENDGDNRSNQQNQKDSTLANKVNSERDLGDNGREQKVQSIDHKKPVFKSGTKDRDRSFKDRHKAKYANHNRKSGAAKKYSKGML